MLETLQRLALRLLPARPAIAVAGLLCAGLTVFALLGPAGTDVLLRLAILGTLWSGLLYAGIELFRSIPPAPMPADRLTRRLGLRIKRFLLRVLAALVVLFTAMMLWMSVRLAFL